MPSLAFNDRSLRGIRPPSAGRVDYFDKKRLGDNRWLGIRVSDTGRKTWFLMYRPKGSGRVKRLTLKDPDGTVLTFPAVGLRAARDTVDAEIAKIAKGGDPSADRRAYRESDTFGDLAKTYIEDYAKLNKKTWKRDQEIIDHDLNPAWEHLKAQDIRRRDVKEVLRIIVNRGAPIGANRALGIARKIFNWAIEEEIV